MKPQEMVLRSCPRAAYALAWKIVRARARFEAHISRTAADQPRPRYQDPDDLADWQRTLSLQTDLMSDFVDMALALSGRGPSGEFPSCQFCGSRGTLGTGWKRQTTFESHFKRYGCGLFSTLDDIRVRRESRDELVDRNRGRAQIKALPPKPEREADTYVIRCASTGRLKIGVAVDVESRRIGLQCGSPTRLDVVATVPGGGYRLERKLHEHCRLWRLHGEWFEAAAWDSLRSALPETTVYVEVEA